MSQRFASPAAEETVACNLIPMIDVMFLLLLFFMLGADMTQRQFEEVRLPQAEQCRPDTDTHCFRPPTITLNVFHPSGRERVVCPAFAAGGTCRDESHWRVSFLGESLAPAALRSVLQDEADRERSTEPVAAGTTPPSLRDVLIRADADAPYALIQSVIESCASVGLCRVEVGAVKPAPSGAR